MTTAFCASPSKEGKLLARRFMEIFGTIPALTFFDLLIDFSIYVLLCFDSHLATLHHRWNKTANALTDLGLAWFVAGLHFYAGASWFHMLPQFSGIAIGATIYILLAITLVDYKIFKDKAIM